MRTCNNAPTHARAHFYMIPPALAPTGRRRFHGHGRASCARRDERRGAPEKRRDQWRKKRTSDVLSSQASTRTHTNFVVCMLVHSNVCVCVVYVHIQNTLMPRRNTRTHTHTHFSDHGLPPLAPLPRSPRKIHCPGVLFRRCCDTHTLLHTGPSARGIQ